MLTVTTVVRYMEDQISVALPTWGRLFWGLEAMTTISQGQ